MSSPAGQHRRSIIHNVYYTYRMHVYGYVFGLTKNVVQIKNTYPNGQLDLEFKN